MALNLLKFESNVHLLLKAHILPNKIATILKKDKESIYNAIKRIKRKKTIKEDSTIKKRGRESKITKRVKRVIKRDILRSPKKINKRLIIENNLGISKRSLQYIFKEEGVTTNIATKTPIISKQSAKLRLIYAKELPKKLEEKEINLKKIIFLDKSAIERGHGARQEYYRKIGSIKAGQQLVSITNRSKFKKFPSILFYSIFYLVFFCIVSFIIARILTTL